MNKKKIIMTGSLVAAVLSCVFAAQGIGRGVHATEDSDFQISGTKLISYKGTDANVLIPSTVTEIGDQAFAENTKLKSVTIPSSVTKINYRAFSGCTSLNNVDIPDSVTTIGPGAFYDCTSLDDFTIGENVSSWGSGVLAGCSSLKTVDIDSDNRYMTYYAGALYNGDMTMLYQVFAGREGENYVMPGTVKTIDTYAFWQCENIKNVSVSNAVKDIPAYAMTNMKSVENVVLPTSVTTISQKAFADNEALKQVEIPPSVSSIHKTAFDNCPNVKILTETDTEAEFYAIQQKIPVISKEELNTDFEDSHAGELIPDSIKKEDKNTEEVINQHIEETKKQTEENKKAQEESEQDNPVATPAENPLTSAEDESVIGKTIIVNNQAIFLIDNHKAKVYGLNSSEDEEETEEQTKEETETEEVAEDETESSQEERESEETEDSQSVSAAMNQQKEESDKDEDSTQEGSQIPERAYYKKDTLTRYTFEKDVTSIGKLAFARTGLLSVVIPETVEYIGYGAFYDCKELGKVTIPKSVKTIEEKAFSNTKWLDTWLSSKKAEGDDFLIVGDGILLAYRGERKDVVLPDTVKIIAAEAFAGHTEIETIFVPKTVTKINAKAFKGCSSLKGLKDCRGLEAIVISAFDDTNLTAENYLLK